MTQRLLERGLVALLTIVAIGMVVHTPLTLWLGLQFPGFELVIKSWKELLMGLALIIFVILASRLGKVGEMLRDKLMQFCLIYAGLHLAMLAIFQNGLVAAGAGILIDLRYILFFVLAYGTIRLLPDYRRVLMYALSGGAVVVIGFALLQIFVLPKDILASIGYSKETISPYLTVDENHDYIRVNSTLRGPNPLGAYAVIIIGLLAALAARWQLGRKGWVYVGLGLLSAGIVVWASYSRSSAIAAIVTLIIIGLIGIAPQWRKRIGMAIAVIGLIGVTGLYAARDSLFVQNVILHNNPTTGADIDSNAGHAESLADGVNRMARQPLGAGVGSTGSASLTGDKPLIIENQYLLIAHEVGWVGLLLFAAIYIVILRGLWRRRKSALALGVFSSGVGLAIIGILLPVWTDDMVSIIWWGLAGVAVAQPLVKKVKKHGRARKSN